MEHVGNIFYRAPNLMLDESATETQKLGRARLIAHETAHMWFGDLVTMKWFNDVWLKEVFANFMAAKAVNPSFPDINHELSFLLSHHPSAYDEDRSGGSHPIQQQLGNLKDAGTLYGRIIYQKAPVVMRQLEQLTGPAAFRDGLREYLHTFAYGNAGWDDLIAILDRQTSLDLKSWSEVWVKEAGMPVLHYEMKATGERISDFYLLQEKTAPNGAYWPQYTEVALLYADTIRRLPVSVSGEKTKIPEAQGLPAPLAVIPNAVEMAYGYFQVEPDSRKYLLANLPDMKDPLLRGAAWIALYESTVRGDIPVGQLTDAVESALRVEREPLNRQYLINIFSTLFWKFTAPSESTP
jgi:aminopeptidase N